MVRLIDTWIEESEWKRIAWRICIRRERRKGFHEGKGRRILTIYCNNIKKTKKDVLNYIREINKGNLILGSNENIVISGLLATEVKRSSIDA